ncbi:MAG: hypothetical protein R3E31_24450 [Chloroflexota bacterium]
MVVLIPAYFRLVGCNIGQPESQEITVFAAASLTDVFDELAKAFQAQNEGVEVILTMLISQFAVH